MSRTGWIAFGILMALSVAGQYYHPAEGGHEPYWWETIPLAVGLFGFAGCALVIVIGKKVVAALLQRPEEYWDER